MGNTETERKLPLISKVGYTVGAVGNTFCYMLVAAFTLLYCTNVIGLNAAVIGTILLVSRLLDGVSDVIMGWIIDRTNSKLGKARFWYIVSAAPLGLFTFLLFNVPGRFTDQTKYIYIFITYTLMSAVAYTMCTIAGTALSALVTKNMKERVQLGSLNFIAAIISSILISSITSGLVDSFGGGQHGWFVVSLIYSVVCTVLILLASLTLKELPPEELYGTEEQQTQIAQKSSLKDAGLLLKNKYFLMILAIYLVQYLCSGLGQGMGIYFATYKLGSPALFGALTTAGMLPICIALLFVPTLSAKLGIKKAAMLGNIVGIFGAVLIAIGGLTGAFALVIAGIVIKGFGTAPLTGALNALIAETDEYSLLKFGKRLTGSIFACSSVGQKVGTGLGTALCGFLLTLGGFDGMAASQTATAVSVINWSYLLSNGLPPVILTIILLFLNVEKDNKKMREAAQQ